MQKKSYIIQIIIALTILFYFFNILYFGINIPHWDDFGLLNSTTKLINGEKYYSSIFDLHNEHRIVVTRLIAMLDVFLFRSINFKFLMLVAGVFYLATFILYNRIASNTGHRSTYTFIIALLLFCFNLYEIQYWGMASVQNFGVILFVFLSIYYISFPTEAKQTIFKNRNRNKIISSDFLAILFAIIALGTSANGVLVFPIGFLLYLINRRYKPLALWTALVGACLFFYFWYFEARPDSPATNDLFSNIGSIFYAFFALLGSTARPFFFDQNLNIVFSFIVGIILSFFYLLFLINQMGSFFSLKLNTTYKSHVSMFIIGTTLFLLISAFGICVSRFSFGIENILSSKYQIYSLLFSASIVVLIGNSKNLNLNPFFRSFIVFLTLVFFLNSFLNYYNEIKNTRFDRIAELKNAKLENVKFEYYNKPKTILDEKLDLNESLPKMDLIEKIEKRGDYFYFSENKIAGKFQKRDDGLFLILESDVDTIYTPFYQQKNLDFQNIVRYDNPTFVARQSLDYVKSGVYKLYLVKSLNNTVQLFDPTKIIRIKGKDKKEQAKNW